MELAWLARGQPWSLLRNNKKQSWLIYAKCIFITTERSPSASCPPDLEFQGAGVNLSITIKCYNWPQAHLSTFLPLGTNLNGGNSFYLHMILLLYIKMCYYPVARILWDVLTFNIICFGGGDDTYLGCRHRNCMIEVAATRESTYLAWMMCETSLPLASLGWVQMISP